MPRPQFRHMRPDEARMWADFLTGANIPPNQLAYDVELGNGMTPQPDWPDFVKRMVAHLTRKRADVVWTTPNAIYIIEIKSRIGTTLVGQLLTYRLLYIQQFKPQQPVEIIALAKRLAPDMDIILEALGIAYFLLPED